MSVETSETITTTTEADVADVMTIAETALSTVLSARAGEDDPTSLALRIEVTGATGTDYTYDLAFEPIDDAEPDDHRQTFGDLTLVIPADSVDKLRGAVLDLPSTAGQAGLVIRNPNRPNPMLDLADLTLTGDAAEQIQQLLAQSINPSLASHGGFATLLGVEGATAYLTMGGGCQGCSMSQATMVDGIASAIREAIPEITEIVDATDHAQGQNPFYV